MAFGTLCDIDGLNLTQLGGRGSYAQDHRYHLRVSVADDRELYPLSRYLGLLPLVLAIWTALLVGREAYTSRRTVALHREAWEVVQVVALGTLLLAACGWLLRLDFVSRPFLVLFGVLNLLFLLGEKVGLRLLARVVRKRGLNYRGEAHQSVAESLV